MRRISANNILRFLVCGAMVAGATVARADTPVTSYAGPDPRVASSYGTPPVSNGSVPGGDARAAQQRALYNYAQGQQPGQQQQGQLPQNTQDPPRTAEIRGNAGDINDPNSPAYKANLLATKAEKERAAAKGFLKTDDVTGEPAPPPELETLQYVNQTLGGRDPLDTGDDLVSKSVSVDLRKEAQKEAALSYGARGGLAKRSYAIMENIRGFEPALDRVFNFRALLVKAPSGLLIEPPIVSQATDAIFITDGGAEAAVANAVYEINKRAKIVSAPRDWRQYLIQSWGDVPPPPRILWPKTAEEQRDWNRWVEQGWQAGTEQAEQIFESNVNRVQADYKGMVRYRVLLAQGMISAPYAMHEDRGVTGDDNQMRVGDSALRITGPSKFLTTKADLWKPADR